jgi:hypothetical protein
MRSNFDLLESSEGGKKQEEEEDNNEESGESEEEEEEEEEQEEEEEEEGSSSDAEYDGVSKKVGVLLEVKDLLNGATDLTDDLFDTVLAALKDADNTGAVVLGPAKRKATEILDSPAKKTKQLQFFDGEEKVVETLTCIEADCGESFPFMQHEKDFFDSKGWDNKPVRCQACRKAKKERNSSTQLGVCYAFKEGNCDRGDSCRFSHEGALA